jgi:hypothetical protein
MTELTVETKPKKRQPTLKKASIKEVYQKNKDRFFIDNEEFHAEIVKAQATGVVSEKLGEIFLKLVQRFATQHFYRGYTFKDDMIMNAVLHNIQRIDRFDTSKGNPFSYYTQCTYFSFLGYIQNEKKALYTKYKATQMQLSDLEGDEHFSHIPQDDLQIMSSYIGAFEKTMKQKKDVTPEVENELNASRSLAASMHKEDYEFENEIDSIRTDLGIENAPSTENAYFDQDLDNMDLYQEQLIIKDRDHDE